MIIIRREPLVRRKVNIHVYHFAHVENDEIKEIDKITFLTPQTAPVLRSIAEGSNTVLIRHEEETRNYSLPLSAYIKACENYAKEVKENIS